MRRKRFHRQGFSLFSPRYHVIAIMLGGLFMGHISAISAQPVAWGVGAGVDIGTVKTSHPSVKNKSGTGLDVEFNLRFGEHFSGRIDVGGYSIDVDSLASRNYPKDKADYGHLNIGVKYDFLPIDQKKWSPWISCDLGLYMIEWDKWAYDMLGVGIAPGTGIDVGFGQFLVRGRYRAHIVWFDAGDALGYGSRSQNGTVHEFALSVLYFFNL